MHTSTSGLPDPDLHAEFYTDIPLKRLIAWAFDSVIVLVLTILVLPLTAFTGLFFFPLLFTMISFAYRVVTISSRSATWGMRLVSIELRDARGERFSTGLAAGHTFLYVAMFWTLLLELASIIMMLTGARRQGLHDLLLGTAAVNRTATI